MKNKKLIGVIMGLIIAVTCLASVKSIECESMMNTSEELNSEASGSISGLGHAYFKISHYTYDHRNLISWGFTAASNDLEVWLFDEIEYQKFASLQYAEGIKLSSGYIQSSGKFQMPNDVWDYYVVFYNPHLLSVSYSNIYVNVGTILIEFVNVYYTPKDSDSDGFDDRLEVKASVAFDVYVYAEGYVKFTAFLYDENDKMIDDRSDGDTIVNAGTLTVTLQNNYGGSGEFTVKLELFFYNFNTPDDTRNPTETFLLYPSGKADSNLLIILLIVGGVLVILIPSLIIILVVRKRRRKQSITQSTDFTEPQEVVENKKVFCIHCGAENEEVEFCISCGEKIVYQEK